MSAAAADYASAPIARIAADCPLCGSPLRRRRNRKGTGEFLGCSSWPRCSFNESIDLNVERISRELNKAQSDASYFRELLQHIRGELIAIAGAFPNTADAIARITRWL